MPPAKCPANKIELPPHLYHTDVSPTHPAVERFLKIESGLNPDFIFALKSCPGISMHKKEKHFRAAIVRQSSSPQIFRGVSLVPLLSSITQQENSR